MRFNTPFSVDEWKKYLSNRLSPTEYKAPAEEVKTKHTIVDDLLSLGTLKLDDGLVPLYHMKLNAKTTPRARVSITRAAYDTIKNDTAIGSALFFITYANDPKYRLSYVKYDRNLKSDPKRYTYLLGKDVPTHTPETRLKPQAFESIEAMEEAFSVEPVNREFYQGIQGYFQKLKETLGGTTEDGDRAIRFIGRLLFCRFLTAKGLVPSGLLEEAASAKKSYQTVLAPLFFQILNKEHGTRTVLPHHEKDIPFLNGGLFAPKEGEESLPIGDNLIHDIFAFLKKYNFTVDESTPTEVEISIDPEMLGRVFENLLAEINPDTRESARKATGAFYTPREIVDYMVVESLKKYLHNHIKIEECRLSALFSTINDHDLSSTEIKDTIKALKDLKILDPACGSGAFPMGLLQRLFDLRQDLHQKIEGKPLASVPSAYQLKKEILQNCIYGVDIQPIAVEISKLRAFLSLVLEEEKTAPEAQNLGIQPLPNLEFNFIIANSLVGLEAEMDGTFRGNFLAGVVKQINEIARLFFSADSPAKKIQAQQRFEAFRHNVKTADDSYALAEDKAKLLSFNPFNNNPAEFFEPHIQFGIEPDKNFGIVIGNPPYLESRNKSFKDTDKNKYLAQVAKDYPKYKHLFSKGCDLSIYFYLRGLRLISSDGVLSYICTNSWLSTRYGTKFQAFLLDENLDIALIDTDFRHFQTALINTIISFISYSPKKNVKFLYYNGEFTQKNIQYAHNFNDNTTLYNYKWGILHSKNSKDLIPILDIMKKYGKPIESFGLSYGQGLNGVHPIASGKIPFFVKDSPRFVCCQTEDKADKYGDRQIPLFILPRGVASTYFCMYNRIGAYSSSYVEILYKTISKQHDIEKEPILRNIWIFYNSTLGWLIRELYGRSNLAGGLLKAEAIDLSNLHCVFTLDSQKTLTLYNQIKDKAPLTYSKEIILPHHTDIDNLIFDAINLSEQQRKFIVEYFLEKISMRHSKSKRVKK